MQKKICTLAASDIEEDARVLLDEIRQRIHLAIPLLASGGNVADYDVVIFVLSRAAAHDESIGSRLKEASGLNKTFIPVIFGGNPWKNLYLRFKFRDYRFRSSYYYVSRIRHKLSLFSQLVSISGAMVVGDPLGKVFSFTSDLDCRIVRDGEIIAEIKKGRPQDVTLYLGKHHLTIKCSGTDAVKEVTISVDSLEDTDKETINTRFISKVRITSSINCTLYDNNNKINAVRAHEAMVIWLTAGAHRLKFLHPVHRSLNRYVTLKLRPDEDKIVEYNFPRTPEVRPFDK